MPSKRVLVTGSSRGIGQAIALRLARDGWQVAVHCAKDQASLDAVSKALGPSLSGRYAKDLSNPANAKTLFDAALSEGQVDAIVNNAGVYLPMDFAGLGDAAFDATYQRTMAINFESPARLIRAATAHFVATGGGKIVNVASRVGFKGESGAALYAASKSALINLTRSLSVELAAKNIQLFGIAPGWVDTAMARDGMEAGLEAILETIPLRRMASPQDCASAVAYLLGEESAYLSGITIDINGASYFH